MVARTKVNVAQCAVAGAGAVSVVFVLCWAAAWAGIGPASHAFIRLFTAAAPSSLAGLATGICAALLFGALAGALFAAFFNLTGRWFQR